MRSQLSHDEFVEKLKNKQRLLYDNIKILSEYKGSKNKILISDKYGELMVYPSSLLSGCKPTIRTAINKTMYFINRTNKIHNFKYDYSKTIYDNKRNKTIIICPTHGEFIQNVGNHLNGNGCKKCVADEISNGKGLFVEKSIKIHGDRYNYKNVEYKNNSTKVLIICSIHGDFKQEPQSHTNGNGCPKCGNGEKFGKYSPNNAEKFKEKWVSEYASIYLIKCHDYKTNENFYKIGITRRKDIRKRFHGNNFPYKYKVLKLYKMSLYDACFLESELHSIFKDYSYIPLINFGGYTECFSYIDLKKGDEIIENYNKKGLDFSE